MIIFETHAQSTLEGRCCHSVKPVKKGPTIIAAIVEKKSPTTSPTLSTPPVMAKYIMARIGAAISISSSTLKGEPHCGACELSHSE